MSEFPQPTKAQIKAFQQWLKTQSKSENTVNQYGLVLKNIPEDVEKYFADKNLKGKKSKMVAYRQFLRFLAIKEKDITHGEYLEGLETFKPPPVRGNHHSDRKKAIPKKKWREYIAKAPNNCTKFTMFCMFNFGLRVGEMATLRLQDISFEDKVILIREHKQTKNQESWHPKHYRERKIPFNERHEKIFKLWINETRPKELEHPYLLWAERNNNPIGIRNLQRYVKKTDLTPHICRYSFATYYYEKTKDIKLICDLLGHSNPSITSEYLLLGQKETLEKARGVLE
ncbi:MAG: tyrosine-type recombinase/integrase [Candidatus Hodarchaeota archaeon]